MNYFPNDSLPITQPAHYWIVLSGSDASSLKLGSEFQMRGEGLYIKEVHCPWHEAWQMLEKLIENMTVTDTLHAAVIASEEEPAASVIKSNLRSVRDIKYITSSLWLGDALLADRVTCFLQPVHDRRSKVFGYESFARVYLDEETLVGGKEIFAASKILNLEFKLDRYLHQKAVESFVASNAENRLFINFQSGFVQRPEVYLEGLSHVVKKYNLPEKNIVLDLTQSESQRNLQHLRSICNYCRQQGYSISLDDITSLKSLEGLLHIIQPDFIKLDLTITRNAELQRTLSMIGVIVETAHDRGITVIAEGVESQAIYDNLLSVDVDLFQGYFIGAPSPVAQRSLSQSA